MLEHIGESDKAKKIYSAVATVVEDGKVMTYDMMKLPGNQDAFIKGAANTTEMADAIIEKIVK